MSNNPVTAKMINIPFFMTDAANGPNEFSTASLTPEMLLAYCSSRLGTLDDQITTIMKEQDRSGKRAAELTKLNAAAGRASVGRAEAIKEEAGLPKREAEKATALLEVYQTSDDPFVKEAAAKEFKITTGQHPDAFAGSTAVTEKDIRVASNAGWIHGDNEADKGRRLDSYKEELGNLNNGAEKQMIELQSLISKRQLAVQLTTQGMQTLNETMKNITGNIGR